MIKLVFVSLFMLSAMMDGFAHETTADSAQMPDSTITTGQYELKAEAIRKRLIAKYGHLYGTKLAENELELGMSKTMCLEICDQRFYDITFRQSAGGSTYETWQFNYDKTYNALAEDTGDKSKALALFKLTESMYGKAFRREMENSVKFKRIQFKNNKLILYEK